MAAGDESRPLTLGKDWPATVQWSAGVIGSSSSIASTSRWPWVSSPYLRDFAGGCVTDDSGLGDERLRRRSRAVGGQGDQLPRAAAAARRIWGTIVGVVRLPKVPRS